MIFPSLSSPADSASWWTTLGLLAVDPEALDEESRSRYAAAYDQPGAVRGHGW